MEQDHIGWLRASALASAFVTASVLGIVVVPQLLLGRLLASSHPVARDAVVVAWTVAAFAATTWVFVRLQRKGIREPVAPRPPEEGSTTGSTSG